jgi:predicted RNase H-like nuclease (RuvC/YqgF family)
MKMHIRSSVAIWSVVASVLLAQTVYAQSLGDIARQQREKNKQHAATTNKVLTNDDLSTPGHSADGSGDSPNTKSAKPKTSPATVQPDKDEQPSAEKLKAAIQDKKQAISETQSEITKLQSTINYVQNNRNIYTNAPEYNEAQKRKEQEVNRLKGILQQQQDELNDLQDAARKAGYGSAIYD